MDEKTEAGHWRAGGLLYRVGKSWERRFLRSADAIVSLTAAGVRALPSLGYQAREGVPVVVIPTCVDLQRFRPTPKDPELVATLGLANGPVIGCVGTMTQLVHARRNAALPRVPVLAPCPPYESCSSREKITAPCDAMPRPRECRGLLWSSRARRSTPCRGTRRCSMPGCSSSGPCLRSAGRPPRNWRNFSGAGCRSSSNDGIGDSGAIVDENRVGIVLPALDKPAFDQSLAEVKVVLANEGLSARYRLAAERFFDVNKGVERYRNLYRHLSGEPPRR